LNDSLLYFLAKFSPFFSLSLSASSLFSSLSPPLAPNLLSCRGRFHSDQQVAFYLAELALPPAWPGKTQPCLSLLLAARPQLALKLPKPIEGQQLQVKESEWRKLI